MTLFFKSLVVDLNFHRINNALKAAYDKFPEAVNNDCYREILKKSLISNGVSSLLRKNWVDSFGCAAAAMCVDSYAPTNPILLGEFDQRDAKNYLTNVDIMIGCRRSLVKYFVKEIPCNCLDDIYSRIKENRPKMGMCLGCTQEKERASLFVCTGYVLQQGMPNCNCA